MAFTTLPKWQMTITMRDSAERDTSVSIYVSKTNADSWNNAASQVAREATNLGAFYLALGALTQCTVTSVVVSAVLQENTPTTPATGLRGNKAVITAASSTGIKQTTTIPAYILANLPVEDDNITLDVNASSPSTEWSDYRIAYLAVALTNEAGTIVGLTKGKLND